MVTSAPSIALGNAKRELVHLASYAVQAFEASYAYISTSDSKYAAKVDKYETAVNTIDESLTSYLIDISNQPLNESENEVLANALDSSRDLERIADHAHDLSELTTYILSKHVVFSQEAQDELKNMYTLTHRLVLDSIRVVVDHDKVLAGELLERHKEIVKLERKYRRVHTKRLNQGLCSAQAGISYVDILSHYTRIADHGINLVEKVIEDVI